MFCPKCKDEYREGFRECADCKIPLVEVLPVEPTPEYVECLELMRLRNAIEGTSLVAFLQSQGIYAKASADDCGGVDPALQFVHGTRIMVEKDSLGKARTLLKQYAALFPDRSITLD